MNNVERILVESAAPADFGRRYADYVKSLLDRMDFEGLNKLARVFEEAKYSGRTVFLAGNGGSAATASHWANDLMLGIRVPGEPPLRAISLVENMPALTASANDRDYADIFVAQLEALFRRGDVLVAISASGRSPNIVKAVEYANAHNGITVGLVGFDGGMLKALCHLSIVVATPQGEYGPVEDIHLILDHIMMMWLKAKFRSAGVE